jgi:hypothetical protein
MKEAAGFIKEERKGHGKSPRSREPTSPSTPNSSWSEAVRRSVHRHIHVPNTHAAQSPNPPPVRHVFRL